MPSGLMVPYFPADDCCSMAEGSCRLVCGGSCLRSSDSDMAGWRARRLPLTTPLASILPLFFAKQWRCLQRLARGECFAKMLASNDFQEVSANGFSRLITSRSRVQIPSPPFWVVAWTRGDSQTPAKPGFFRARSQPFAVPCAFPRASAAPLFAPLLVFPSRPPRNVRRSSLGSAAWLWLGCSPTSVSPLVRGSFRPVPFPYRPSWHRPQLWKKWDDAVGAV
jgi:hypothetical protein